MENISFVGLKTALKRFDTNGRYAGCKNWSIANGGYDCGWEIYYKGYTVLQCINGKLQGGFRPTPEFTEETEKQLIQIINEVYKDINGKFPKEDIVINKDLRPFIKHCLSDNEFWVSGGIPTKEQYYIKKLGMTKEQEHEFYKAMCSLQSLAKELNGK